MVWLACLVGDRMRRQTQPKPILLARETILRPETMTNLTVALGHCLLQNRSPYCGESDVHRIAKPTRRARGP